MKQGTPTGVNTLGENCNEKLIFTNCNISPQNDEVLLQNCYKDLTNASCQPDSYIPPMYFHAPKSCDKGKENMNAGELSVIAHNNDEYVIASGFLAERRENTVIASEAKQSRTDTDDGKQKLNDNVTLNLFQRIFGRAESSASERARKLEQNVEFCDNPNNSRQGRTHAKEMRFRNKFGMTAVYAFSLIELMISLIVVSCITAAFTPVITKKLKSGSLIAGSVGDAFRNSKMGLEDCKEFTGIDNCMFCDTKKKECKVCAGSACDNTHQYTISKNCSCGECSDKYPNCQTCSETACTSCKNGTLLKDNICQDCPSGKICDGTSKTPKDPEPGYYAKDGEEFSCSNAIAGCLDCTSTQVGSTVSVQCNKCEAERYLVSNKLKCETCLSTQYCPEGTTQNSIKNCSEQTLNCAECSATKCTKCISTNKLSTNLLGITSCTTCSAGKMCDGTTEEKECNLNGVNDHYCIDGIRSACSSKTPGCTRCDVSTGDCTTCTLGTQKLNSSTKKCENCDTGYWCSNGISKDSNICTSNCATCANSSSCSTCSGNFVKEANGTCTSCPSGYWCSGGNKYPCPEGSYSNGGATATSKSACNITQPTGKWCKNGSCNSCGDGCTTCASANTCTTCTSGYYKNGSNACSTCPSGYWCAGNNKVACEQGKWSTGGATATSSAVCTTDNCGAGYWCENGSKTKCSDNCSSCASATKCSSSGCTGGMQLDSNGKCSTPAGACSSTSTGACCTNDTSTVRQGWRLFWATYGASDKNHCITSDGKAYRTALLPSDCVYGAAGRGSTGVQGNAYSYYWTSTNGTATGSGSSLGISSACMTPAGSSIIPPVGSITVLDCGYGDGIWSALNSGYRWNWASISNGAPCDYGYYLSTK